MPIHDFVPAALEPTKPVSNSQEAGALHERLFMLICLMLKRIEGKGSWTSHSYGYLNQGHALAVVFGSVGTARCELARIVFKPALSKEAERYLREFS
ncbi:MAG: hypothetical protein JW732_09725 [Dehalococcoidia bacterium]|nr:hypothetical protein [Dehalococcoidia bacterium]